MMRKNLMTKQTGPKKQGGSTFLGMLFVGAALVFVAL
ncbi:MAG: LPXTG cell wall anchor domain-containing protein, partial [Methylotenera sp.]|nr:LPXTG cell wall anchor domain-containing protein [Methylotenera sp.]